MGNKLDVKHIRDLQESSERYEADCPGKRLRIGSTWAEYVGNYALSYGEYLHFAGNVPTPSDHGQLLRINAPVFQSHLVDEKEWCETLPAMKF